VDDGEEVENEAEQIVGGGKLWRTLGRYLTVRRLDVKTRYMWLLGESLY